MADIGSAGLSIVPHFDGLTRAVNQALAKVDGTKSGQAVGESVSEGVGLGTRGLAASGAIMGVFSEVAGRAMDAVASHVGSAVSRLDTLNNYPRVMESLGTSSAEAQASIGRMSDRLSNLPTTLSSMASSTQSVYAACSSMGVSLTDATDAALGLNDMLLAGGQGTAMAESAMTQFTQALAKGKPDMQDWRSIVMAAPGQMNQLAQSMLGPTANSNDLYEAIKNDEVSMRDVLDAIIDLDQNGGEGFSSFADQAEEATGGIQTAMDNMENAITKGLANVLDSVGSDTITGMIDTVKGGINRVFGDVSDLAGRLAPVISSVFGAVADVAETAYGAFGGIADALRPVLPSIEDVGGAVTSLLGDIRPLVPAIVAVATAQAGVSAGTSIWKSLTGVLGGAGAAFTRAGQLAGRLGEAVFDNAGLLGEFGGVAEGAGLDIAGLGTTLGKVGSVISGPWGVAIAAAAAGVALLVGHVLEARQRQEDWNDSLRDMSDTTGMIDGMSSYGEMLAGVGEQAAFSALSIDELRDSIDAHQDAIRSALDGAQETISTLTTAQGIIDAYAGQTDLSTDAQGRLEWALQQVNDQLGLSISAQDVANGYYEDANGDVQELTQSIDELVQSKIEEARVSALTASLTEAYQQQEEAARTLTQAQDAYDEKLRSLADQWGVSEDAARDLLEAEDAAGNKQYEEAAALQNATDAYAAATDQVDSLTDQLGDSVDAANEANGAYSQIAAGMYLVSARLEDNGTSLSDFRGALSELGADTDALKGLSEEDMLAIAQAYDGTTGSIIGELSALGISMDEAAIDGAWAATQVKSALDGMGDAGSDAAASMDMSMADLATALAGAGITTEQLESIGSDNFARLADNCDGDMGRLIASIEMYNAEPVLDKDGSVTVDGTQLVDAQNNVYTWNGEELLDKDNEVVTDDVELTDAYGNVVTWNRTRLVPKSTTATATGNATDGSARRSIGDVKDIIDRLKDKSVTVTASTSGTSSLTSLRDLIGSISSKTVTVTTYSRQLSQNAAGGIRGHADGMIATRAVPLDIVGEDGAEAIVPLTNSRYTQPFADVLADGISRRLDGGGRDAATLVAWLDRNLGPTIRQYAPTATAREFNRMVRGAVS